MIDHHRVCVYAPAEVGLNPQEVLLGLSLFVESPRPVVKILNRGHCAVLNFAGYGDGLDQLPRASCVRLRVFPAKQPLSPLHQQFPALLGVLRVGPAVTLVSQGWDGALVLTPWFSPHGLSNRHNVPVFRDLRRAFYLIVVSEHCLITGQISYGYSPFLRPRRWHAL